MKRIIKKFSKLSIVTVILMGIISTYAGIQYFNANKLETKLGKDSTGSHVSATKIDDEYSGDISDTSQDQGIHILSIDGSGATNVYCANFDLPIPTTTDGWTVSGESELTQYDFYQNGLQWIMDYMWLDSSDAAFDQEIFEYVLRRWGHVEDTGSVITQITSGDIYAVNQTLIWLAINNEFNTRADSVMNSRPAVATVMSAYDEARRDNSGYTRNTPGCMTLSKESAVMNTNGVAGPFQINGNGGIYKFTVSGSVNGNPVNAVAYKNAECTDPIATIDEYNGDVYVKLDGYNTGDTANIDMSLKYSYLAGGSFYYTSSPDPKISDDSPQTLLSAYKAFDSTQISFSGDTDIPKSGSFDIKLIKYEKGTDNKLAGAEFKVEIPELNYSDTKTTGDNGEASFNVATINGENQEYTVKVTELTPPPGYIGVEGTKEFKVRTQLEGETKYKLVPNHEITVENLKSVDVSENEIVIEAENRTTSIDIHKGVKTVENQDSGYYSVAEKIKEAEEEQAKEDSEQETEYKDESTGKKYTEIELEDLQHEWVVETTIPEGINNYNRYMVNDPIDTTKLDFSGLDKVKVELIDSTGKVTKALVKDKDYQAKYGNNVLTITYIDKKDGNNFYGEFLSEATTSNKIRLTFNTTFKVNPETGKLVVLEGAISNATNQATLKYDNGSGEDKEKKSENPEVHTGGVSVFKYGDTNKNGKHDEGEKALVGAEFKIALSEDDAKNGKFIKIDGKELVAISNEHGLATFIGLEFGGDAEGQVKQTTHSVTGAPVYEYDWETASRDYYIVETKSPGGYKKLDEVIKVTVSKDSSEIIDLTDKINEMESVANIPLKFDLALRKWVTHAIVYENGKEVDYETGHKAEDDPEAIVKVDLKKSKLNNVTVKFRYSIRVTNEGEIAGEAREVTDYIPEGLRFDQADNPNWTTTDNERVVKTRLLEGVTLEPGESAEVEILLTWINSKDSMGVMVNTAEISEDYNEYGVHDIDSTPNNKKWGEDDIDDAPVMLAIKTGSEVVGYVTLGVSFVTIITLGVVEIKKRIL